MKKQKAKDEAKSEAEIVFLEKALEETMEKTQKDFRLEEEKLVAIHDLMLKARLLEERLIRMYKQSDGYFWIGGPGEEAFNVSLGLQVKKGQGLNYDYLHLHYRSGAILTAMGMNPRDAMRQMKNTASDPFSGGRNFSNHYSIRKWNIVPVSSTIETQYATAIGTGIAHRRHGGQGITIVNGGDAGTAEGEFESSLIWSSRPGQELPMLIVVTDNRWGISTHADTQRPSRPIAERGRAHGMKTASINGNDVEEAYLGIQKAMEYVRRERKPFLLEARVSRLYGHSSATGCNFASEEFDCLTHFEEKLEAAGILSQKKIQEKRDAYLRDFLDLSQNVKQEVLPSGSSIYDSIYYGQKGRYW